MKNQRLILTIMIVSFIVLILVATLSALLAKKQLDLYNIDQVESGLNERDINDLERFLWESLQRTQEFGDEKDTIAALIRPSSFIKTENEEIKNYSFLIDIDEFKATYQVSFALVGNNGFYEAPMIDCPTPNLMKYPTTYCKGDKTSTMLVTIGRNLPHYFNLKNGELATVRLSRLDDGQEYLQVRVSSCGDSQIVTEAKEEVREWIKSLGYNPDDYQIKIPEFCDGEAK